MTGRAIYNLSAQLIACKNTDGTDNPDCNDYISRSPALISILLAENIETDRLLRNDFNARALPITNIEETVNCHELVAYGILPFGLASLLVADEDPELSRSLYERYLLNIKNIKEGVTAITHQIDDCYNYNG